MDNIIGDIEVAPTRAEFISAMVQAELAASVELLPTFLDVSEFAQPGFDSISFPKSTSFVVEKKQSGQKVNAQAFTLTNDTLLLDEHAVVQWIIEKKASIQSKVALEMQGVKLASSAQGRIVDVDLIAAIDAGRKVANDVTLGSSLTIAVINEARRILKTEFWPKTDLWLALHPNQEEEMLNITNFIEADKYGSRVALLEGEIGKVFGVRIVVSNLLTADEAFMYHKNSTAIGFQSAAEFDEQKDLENLGMRSSVDQLYGIKVLQSGSGIVKIA